MYKINLIQKYNKHFYEVIETSNYSTLWGEEKTERTIGVFPSSTTILAKHKNAQPLINWAARIATEYITKEFNESQLIQLAKDPDRLNKIFFEAKEYHEKYKQKRAGEGSEAHHIFELYNKNCLPKKLSDLERAYLKQYKKFLKECYVEPIPSCAEIQAFTTEGGGSAGTLDNLAYVKKKLTLIDYKTSKDIYYEYWLQVSSYVKMFNQCKHGLNIPQKVKDTNLEQAGILRISETDYEFRTISKKAIDIGYKIFICYVKTWHLDKELKQLIKDN